MLMDQLATPACRNCWHGVCMHLCAIRDVNIWSAHADGLTSPNDPQFAQSFSNVYSAKSLQVSAVLFT